MKKVQISAQMQLGKHERLKQPQCSYTEAVRFSGEKQAKTSQHTHTHSGIFAHSRFTVVNGLLQPIATHSMRVCLSVRLVKYKQRNWHGTKCTINIQRFLQVQVMHKQISILSLSCNKKQCDQSPRQTWIMKSVFNRKNEKCVDAGVHDCAQMNNTHQINGQHSSLIWTISKGCDMKSQTVFATS